MLGFGNGLLLVIHLMIVGRLLWRLPGAKSVGKITLASLEFESGSLRLTEAGTQRRASIRLLADPALSRLLKASWPRHIDDLA